MPVVIYLIRKAIIFWFQRAISSTQEYLKVLQAEQKEKIEELKQSTNFYSTKALLERFDSSFTSESQATNTNQLKNRKQGQQSSKSATKPSLNSITAGANSQQQQPSDGKKGHAKRNSIVSDDFQFSPNLPSLQQSQNKSIVGPDGAPQMSPMSNTFHNLNPQPMGPNINANPGQFPVLEPVHNTNYQPKWYDRILDVIVGEDEYSPKARYALICENCRNHNGLAQPGELPEYVVYICPHCGFRNGHEKHKKRHITEKSDKRKTHTRHGSSTAESVASSGSSTPNPLLRGHRKQKASISDLPSTIEELIDNNSGDENGASDNNHDGTKSSKSLKFDTTDFQKATNEDSDCDSVDSYDNGYDDYQDSEDEDEDEVSAKTKTSRSSSAASGNIASRLRTSQHKKRGSRTNIAVSSEVTEAGSKTKSRQRKSQKVK